jgi:hypothetical protein
VHVLARRLPFFTRRIDLSYFQSAAYAPPIGWWNRCTWMGQAQSLWARLLGGANVTVVYAARSENPPKSRPALLPLLIVLFIASYTILTLLVVEQGRTIEAQRGLLRDMLKDSTQLAQLKGKLARESDQQPTRKSAEQSAKEHTEHAIVPAPRPKTPAGSETHRRAKAPHTMKEIPPKPAEDLQDVRRSTRVI